MKKHRQHCWWWIYRTPSILFNASSDDQYFPSMGLLLAISQKMKSSDFTLHIFYTVPLGSYWCNWNIGIISPIRVSDSISNDWLCVSAVSLLSYCRLYVCNLMRSNTAKEHKASLIIYIYKYIYICIYIY